MDRAVNSLRSAMSAMQGLHGIPHGNLSALPAICLVGGIYRLKPRLTSAARCNLSFLSIQEPGITKTCSNCGTEYLNEEQIQPAQGIYELISNAFDTCIYCDGKFRD